MRRFSKILGIIMITALIAVSGTYILVNHQAKYAKNKLSSKVSSLETQVSSLYQQLASLKSVSTSTSSSSDGVLTPLCQSSFLKPSLSNGNGTAGSYYYTLSIENSGTQTCRYKGYTMLFVANTGGNVIGKNATVDASSDINIPNGKSINASVGFPDPSNFSTSECLAGVMSLIIYPPGQTSPITVASLKLPTGNEYCPGFSLGDFTYN